MESQKEIELDPKWDALVERARATGRELGITDEDAVERLSDQYRSEKR